MEAIVTQLAEAGIHSLVWGEEDGVVHAEGLQDYEIDDNNELAIFQGETCVVVHECASLHHAVAIAEASERVCRWNISMGATWGGAKINERGWKVRS